MNETAPEREARPPSDVVYDAHPDTYRHWKLSFDGPIASLALGTDEEGGIRAGYRLKLNSYDLGVDIELHDALQRIRFEHPEVKCVVITSSKDRIFCSGANIFMLGLSSHAWKVNFCKFTNETRNGIEDSSRHSGLKFLAACNGTTAGGGYELALACDEILLIDDRSSAVSLPEVPLLGVLPGTGGLTRVTDKRHVRRDHADILCTLTEGVRAPRAKEWRLVDDIAKPLQFAAKVKERALALAGMSDRPADAKGVALMPIARKITADGYAYEYVDVRVDKHFRTATLTVRAPYEPEPASVEQQRHLGRTAPSLYDLRNLFQVNVEEGRHLWAMVYLLHAYFGRDGREEAEALLERRSGDADNPRILGAFNERTPDWLAFFMFTYFTDRDGKFQLCSLAESGFDPLARTTRFMLTEEAHHMFIGESGVGRIIARTAEVMARERIEDPVEVRKRGVIDLPTIQRYLNFHFSVTMDLFGADVSSNAATFYSTGLKGRFEETKAADDHLLAGVPYPVLEVRGDHIVTIEAPALNALNERLRDDFIKDATSGVERWNRILQKQGLPFAFKVPHKAFNRKIGPLSAARIDPEGRVVSDAEWSAHVPRWLPSESDRAFVASLMGRVVEAGKFANWIAPPSRGINNLPIDYQYVRFN